MMPCHNAVMTKMADPSLVEIVRDLEQEHRSLAHILDAMDESYWYRDTASTGWQVRHQISHLAFFDHRAVLALLDPDAFVEDRRRIMASAPHDPSVDMAETSRPADLRRIWYEHSQALIAASRQVPPGMRVPWYGPSMSTKSFLTARLMECWAHGEDVAAAVSLEREGTSRLRHVAHIGVATRAFCLSINGLPADDSPVVIELRSPDGDIWKWESGTSTEGGELQSIRGEALDFCRVVTQRRRIEETTLAVVGIAAQSWMDVAQAFAGPPGRKN